MKYPLQIYVVWQNTEGAGQENCFQWAQTIFCSLSRKITSPAERGMGIPTYFISEPVMVNSGIQWDVATKTVVVLLITNGMICNKSAWENELNQLVRQTNEPLIIPVALTKNAHYFSDTLELSKWIVLFPKEEQDKQETKLLSTLALYLMEELQEDRSKPINLFISHHQADGENIVTAIEQAIKQYDLKMEICVETPSFGNKGYFEAQIKQKIEQSIFLIINTNLYNKEDYCLQVLLHAKQHNRPAVLLNAQQQMAARTWPYLGNIPSIQLPIQPTLKDVECNKNGKKEIYEVLIYHLCLEGLRFLYQYNLLSTLIQRFDLDAVPFAVAPELLTLHQKNIQKGQVVFYPDPPLAYTEINLLQTCFDTPIITPTLYPILIHQLKDEKNATFQYDSILDDCVLGFSASEAGNNYKGTSHLHIQDALVELARYLLICGVAIAYGGSLRYKEEKFNLLMVLVELVRMYQEYNVSNKKIKNYIVPIEGEVIEENWQASYMDAIEFIHYKQENNIVYEINPTCSLSKVVYNALQLSKTRQNTFKHHSDAQVFMGGKLSGYQGVLPGVIEEAYWALKADCPIYIIGAFGGAAGALADLLLTGESEQLREALSNRQQQESWQLLYQEYVQAIEGEPNWDESARDISKRVRYEHLKLFFLKQRQKKAGNYLNNGLTRAENEQLFETKNILQISSLVLKGLHTYFNLFQ